MSAHNLDRTHSLQSIFQTHIFFSFEPFEQSYNLLNENLKLNDIHNVNTHNIALSDVCGTSTLNTSISHNGFHTLGENPLRFTDIKPVQIH